MTGDTVEIEIIQQHSRSYPFAMWYARERENRSNK
jgi:hypothetical protein